MILDLLRIRATVACAAALPLAGVASAFDYGGIDPARMPVQDWKDTRWIDPGGWTTIDVTEHGLLPNTASIDAAAKIAQIVQSTSGRRRLHFPKGVYYFKSSLTLTTGDLWIDGEGYDKTIFQISAPGSANAEIRFRGSTGAVTSVTGSVPVGATSVTVADAGSIAVGDIVQLYADNAPIANGGLAWSFELYAQLFRVVARSGNTLTLDMKVLLNYDAAYSPRLRRLDPVRNVKIRGVKIERINQPSEENVTNLFFANAYNCTVTEIESSFSGRNHIHFEMAKDCVIERNYVHDCWRTKTGGYGYGYSLVATTGCRITNNKAARLRHHVVLQAGANHNVVSYNSVESPHDYNDVAFHATWAYMNLVEGNAFTESYADFSKDGQSIEARTGPGNTWFRNFAVANVGSIQGATTRQNILGNIVGSISASGSDHYVGANSVGGTIEWGVLNSSSVVPSSLYLTSRPSFFKAGMAWPLFGPGVAAWGAGNTVPARSLKNLFTIDTGAKFGAKVRTKRIRDRLQMRGTVSDDDGVKRMTALVNGRKTKVRVVKKKGGRQVIWRILFQPDRAKSRVVVTAIDMLGFEKKKTFRVK